MRRASSLEVDDLTGEPLVDRLEQRYGATLAAIARRLDPRITEERIATRLVSSGLAKNFTANGFLALKVVLASAGIIVGGLIGVLMASGSKALILGAGLGIIGFLVPDMVANSKARRRVVMRCRGSFPMRSTSSP